jgi:hypothetical protein
MTLPFIAKCVRDGTLTQANVSLLSTRVVINLEWRPNRLTHAIFDLPKEGKVMALQVDLNQKSTQNQIYYWLRLRLNWMCTENVTR